MEDVLGGLLAQCSTDFLVGLAVKTVGGSEASKVMHALDVSYQDVWHFISCASY